MNTKDFLYKYTKLVVTFFNTVQTISNRVRSSCTDYFILLQFTVVHPNVFYHLVVNRICFDRKHVWVSSVPDTTEGCVSFILCRQVIWLKYPVTRWSRSVSYVGTVKTRARPQEAIEGPLLLGSLALLGAG